MNKKQPAGVYVPYHAKYGDLESRMKRYVITPPRGSTLKERLMFFMVVDHVTGCWNWTANKNQKGYGRVAIDGRLHSAHRVSFEIFNGPLIDGLEVDHVCENRGCINPAHLQQITHASNVRKGNRWNIERPTHCPRGHPFTAPNLGHDHRGWRYCKACASRRHKRRKEEMRNETQIRERDAA